MLRYLIIIAALIVPSAASAEPNTDFARHMGVTQFTTTGVYGFDLSHNGWHVDRIIIGQNRTKWGLMSDVVLVSCVKKKCWTRKVRIGKDEKVRALKIVDLEGAPTSLHGYLGDRASKHYRRLHTRDKRRPVLVLETRWRKPGTKSKRPPPGGRRVVEEVRRSLVLISLHRKDFSSPRIFRKDISRRYSYGHGHHSLFSLVRGKGRALDIQESRRRNLGNGSKCRAPKPTTHRYQLKNRRYREKRTLHMSKGCR